MNLKIGKKESICWICLIAIWIPSTISAGNALVSLLKFLGLMWSIYLFVIFNMSRQHGLGLYFVWLIWCMMATVLNGTSVSTCFAMIHPIFSTICMLNYLFRKNGMKALKQLLVVLCAWTVFQFISFMDKGASFGTSVNEVSYFFGIRVNYNDFYVFAVGCSLLAVALKIQRAKIVALIIIGLGTIFAATCKLSTAIMAGLIVLCVYLVSYFVKSGRFWKGLSTFAVVFCLMFVLGSTNPDQFSWLLVDFLGEDLTLNGRTVLWQQALTQMEGVHWLIGNGYAHGYQFELSKYWSATTAHSQYVNALFCFGIIGIGLYIAMLLRNLFLIKKVNRKFWTVIISVNTSMIFMGISTTFYASPYMYVWFVVCMALEQGHLSDK